MRDRTLAEIALEMAEIDLETLLRASGVEPGRHMTDERGEARDVEWDLCGPDGR